ncbi:MAG: TIGR03792 family protein [Prochlorothrix sp.]
MVIEWLEFKVERSIQTHFLECDRQIWTAALATCPGYHSKEVWQDPKDLNKIIVMVRWTSRDQWQSIDPQWLAELEAQFQGAVGAGYSLVVVKEFVVLA